MSTQATDLYGAADFLGLTPATVRRRIKAGTFPLPDATEHEVEWWELDTLDKYRKALQRKKRTRRKPAR